MFSNDYNLNHLRIFECVYRTRSMTRAASELHLTQSGVSQHVRALEEALSATLFDRVAQKIVPTSAATVLYGRCVNGLHEIERGISEITGEDKELHGRVRIGMPIEFGNNVIMPLIAKFCAEHPNVRFEFELGFASQMNDLLLQGKLDFALIDEFPMDKAIEATPVYNESLELCIHRHALPQKALNKTLGTKDRKFFESLFYVEYQSDQPLLRRWFAHHLSERHLALHSRATVMDVQGVARLIVAGVGAGILPSHLVHKLQKEGHLLVCFRGSSKPLQNRISLVSLNGRTQPKQVSAALHSLKNALLRT